ncbi:alpha/beta hydrolase [Flavobacterium terrae]|uniref:Predicted hydrolase of the alpha/beta superfamily n=1 Tax=Flavobacterium terrae TaxID=415425 RepID=A0A1M6GIC3_9FLAO|nr:alpha/beta hydrolase-fold protein [Flavobacterium terrae]SHJ09661.1 Predicted hydrolase of the alpha/beta superfamily [Flavobacterium terrae]
MLKQIIFFVTFLFPFLNTISQESTASKQVSTFSIEAPQLNTSKKIWVYLPKNYSESKKKYPVIYMHDAQNLFDKSTSFAGEWNIDETLDSLNAEVIVVGIEHGNEKRIEELTPFKNEKYGGGNADNYLDFLVKTLKPQIDKTYRTNKKVEVTTIAGSSLGGLVSYYALLKYPDVFGKAIIFSPSFWLSNEIYTLTENSPKINTKMYFLCGDNEDEAMVNDLNKMTDLLKRKVNSFSQIEIQVIEGGQHNEKLWREAFPKAYLWLLK